MDKRIPECTNAGGFRGKVASVLRELENAGFTPFIAEGRRTVEQQRAKVAAGYSKTMQSKHLPGDDGLCRAVDIVPIGAGWNAPREFWLTLGRCAVLHGLDWGGLWIGNAANPIDQIKRAKLRAFLTAPGEWKPGIYSGPIGWDAAHIESKQ